MAQDIVGGLFGPQPWQIQQARQDAIAQAADRFAAQSPFERAAGLGYRAGAGLGQMAGGMLGLEDPAVVEAQQRRAALEGLDITSPESILQRAQQIQDPQMRMRLMLMADQKKKEHAALALEAAKVRREEFRMGEEFEWKKQQAKDALEQKAEAARLRSEDMRYSAEQRAAAAKEAAQTRLLIAQMMAEAKRAETARKAAEGPKLSNFDAKSLERSDKAAEAANPALQLLEQAERLYGGYQSSRTEPIIGGAARVAASMGVGGVEAKKRASDYETAQQIAKDLGVIKLGLIGGSDTERELQVAIDTAPSPDKTVEANLAIIANQKKAISILQSEPDFKREWIERNGSLAKKDSVTGDSYGAAWRKFQKANFKAPTAPTGEPSAPTTPPAPFGPYSDAEKEARYQEWKKKQSGGK